MHFKRFEFIIRLLLLNLVLTFIVEYYTDGWLEKIPKILKHGMSLTDYKRIQFHHIVFDYFGSDIYLTYCVEIYIYIYLSRLCTMVYISIPFFQVDILFRFVRMFILFFTWYHLTFIISSFCTDGDWFFF